MKTRMKAVLAAALFGGIASATAGPCVVLEYQEMKDMEVAPLTAEYCKALDSMSENMSEAIEDLGRRRPSNPKASEFTDQCRGQTDRIGRVLAQKGVVASYRICPAK